jgi:hypothetical protein
MFGLRLSGLSDEECREHRADENPCANDPDPTILHDFPQNGGIDKIRDLHEPGAASSTIAMPQAPDSSDHKSPFIDRCQAFSAKTSSSASAGIVPIAYWMDSGLCDVRCSAEALIYGVLAGMGSISPSLAAPIP